MEISIVSVSDCLTFVGLMHCLHSSVHTMGGGELSFSLLPSQIDQSDWHTHKKPFDSAQHGDHVYF